MKPRDSPPRAVCWPSVQLETSEGTLPGGRGWWNKAAAMAAEVSAGTAFMDDSSALQMPVYVSYTHPNTDTTHTCYTFWHWNSISMKFCLRNNWTRLQRYTYKVPHISIASKSQSWKQTKSPSKGMIYVNLSISPYRVILCWKYRWWCKILWTWHTVR